MTTKYSFCLKKLTASLIIFLFCGVCFAAQTTTSNTNWIIAAEQFASTQKKADPISNALTIDIPNRILEKLDNSLFREIPSDESYERETNKLKNDRLSLFLQLSNAVKKRDALVLENYTERELKTKIAAEEKTIQEIKDKIDENLKQQKEIRDKLLSNNDSGKDTDRQSQGKNTSEKKDGKLNRTFEEYKTFFKNVFEDEEEVIIEKITPYTGGSSNSGGTGFYTRSSALNEADYGSKVFEDEMLAKKINALLYGQITIYGDYLFVTATVRVYPGAKELATVSEAGSIEELDLISDSIAQSLIPSITNSLPISLYVSISPPEAAKKAIVYIDEVIYQNNGELITLDSGVHFVQIVSENYRTAGTTYFFNGNTKYLVEVELEPSVQGELYLSHSKNLAGTFYQNGLTTPQSEDGKSVISINGDVVLGQFIAENGEGAFFYIPENMITNLNSLEINAKPFDRNDYIEKYRRKSYNAYSILIISLIPHFVAKGQYKAREGTDNAQVWKIASTATSAVAIGCGAWFVYNLVRYFIAADSVIPVQPHKDKKADKKQKDKEKEAEK